MPVAEVYALLALHILAAMPASFIMGYWAGRNHSPPAKAP